MLYAEGLVLCLIVLLPGIAAVGSGDTAAGDAMSVPVTIAVAEVGFNVYHDQFRRSDWTAHPSTYIPGYPVGAVALWLSLDAPDLETALEQDKEILDNMEAGVLYYVPGTNIVGLISPKDLVRESNWLFVDPTHGTQTAATAAGKHGQYPEGALVLMPYNSGDIVWSAQQPWIDLVYDTYSCTGVEATRGFGPAPWLGGYDETTALKEFYDSGRVRLQAAGNSWAAVDVACPSKSHAWTMRVGGFVEEEGQSRYRCPACPLPHEVLADYTLRNAPDGESMDGEYGHPITGTSFSAPRATGHLAELIAFSRDLLDWPRGHEDGYYAQAGPGAEIPARGPLADGKLNRSDLVMTYLRTAAPLDQDTPTQYGLLPEEHRYWWRGYGAADDDSVEQAKRVLAGVDPMPERPHEDEAYTTYKTAMRDYWNYEECRRSSSVQTWISCPRDVESV